MTYEEQIKQRNRILGIKSKKSNKKTNPAGSRYNPVRLTARTSSNPIIIGKDYPTNDGGYVTALEDNGWKSVTVLTCFNETKVVRRADLNNGEVRTNLASSESTTPIGIAFTGMRRRAMDRGDSCNVEPYLQNYKNFREWVLANGWFDGCVVCRNGDTGDYSRDNIRLDTRASNTVEAHAKTYYLIDPKGKPTAIYNMTQFCRDNPEYSKCKSSLLALAKDPTYSKSFRGWKRASPTIVKTLQK